MIKAILQPLASLRLTVVLLALTMILVFAGTWAQIDHDVWTVQQRYFYSFITWVDFAVFLPREGSSVPGGFPLPGGYTLVGLILINLIAAHWLRFKFTQKRLGIILIHAGLILLIVGEVITSVAQREGQMLLHEGETASFASDVRSAELAVIDHSPAERDIVTSIPPARLVREDSISYPSLPFTVKVEKYLGNSTVLGPFQARQANLTPPVPVTAGIGKELAVAEQKQVTGTGADAQRVDMPAAYVSLIAPDGTKLGTFLVSNWIDQPQKFDFAGKSWSLQLRPRRDYKPYSLTLLEFKHDRYTGTNVPRNFSSKVRLVDPVRNESREVLIWMNHPMRYAGETFYQAGFDQQADRFTILQVVRNPGWLIPYISCSIVTLGLLVHFGATLLGFLRKTVSRAPAGGKPGSRQYTLKPQAGVLWPALATGLCALYLLSAGRPPKTSSPFDLNAFARIPISYEGRVMPLDTLARTSLRITSGKSELRSDGSKLPAIQWLADVFGDHERATAQKIFRIDLPELKGILGLDTDAKMFSVNDLLPASQQFDEQHRRAAAVLKKDRTLFQKSVIDLGQHITLFNRLAGIETLFVAPPYGDQKEWISIAQAAEASHAGSAENPGLLAFVSMLRRYHEKQPEQFNAAAADYLAWMSAHLPAETRRASFEVLFNHLEPFVHTMTLYVLVFLLVCASWLFTRAGPTLRRTAFWIMLLALVAHTAGLAARIYIQGRPPVTNLYSSAVFIGWAAVVFCAVIERIYRNGIGMLAGSIVAFPTLIIAHFLAGSGDTMEMLQAVLDTNIWLATHVVVITLGYAATFLAGIIGAIYIVAGVFTRALQAEDRRKSLTRMIYGVVCFAMLFSFVGTILGGIWADQSWGRFWGWDPKENGAVLIVLWNAIILHARWGGLARERGFAALAVFGNIVTSWSWFGTNMLGVGLHSYGFMDSAVFWLAMFIASQLLLIAIGLLPLSLWRSFYSAAPATLRSREGRLAAPLAGR